MSIKFKSIDLTSVFGYRRATFALHPQLNMFYGPNGCGKSNILAIANILSSPQRFRGRDVSMLLRKTMFHEDYDPGYQAFMAFNETARAVGTFVDETGKEYVVELEMDPAKIKLINEYASDPTKTVEYLQLINEVGIIRNELPSDKLEYAFLSDADNPMNLSKFQLEAEVKDLFLDIAKAIYGYECYLEKEVEERDKQTGKFLTFFTDFIIVKEDDGEGFEPVRVHYRSMSAGERKIATLLKQLCSPLQRERSDIYLVDNLEMHAYMTRHIPMIDKIMQRFPEKQFLATTHSPILVGLPGVIQPYLKPEHLQEVVAVRRQHKATELSNVQFDIPSVMG